MERNQQIILLTIALLALIGIRLYFFVNEFSVASIIEMAIVVLISALFMKVFNLKRLDQ